MTDSPFIGFNLLRLAESTTNAFIKQLKVQGIHDIRAAHLSVFRELEPEGSRVVDMANRANMTKQSMSALVNHLEDRGYVKRIPDSNDKRAKLVTLTDKGQSIVILGMETGTEIERRWQAKLGKKDFAKLRDFLKQLSN